MSTCRASTASKAVELKLDGTKDEELYRLLLLAQCNALHQAMPFLFETHRRRDRAAPARQPAAHRLADPPAGRAGR